MTQGADPRKPGHPLFQAPRHPYSLRRLIRGGLGYGSPQGLHVDSQGRVYLVSMIQNRVVRVSFEPFLLEELIEAPLGSGDDIYVDEATGDFFYTSYLTGEVLASSVDGAGEVRVIAEGMTGINSIHMSPSAKLYAGRAKYVMLDGSRPDQLYEIDPSGEKPPVVVMEDMGQLNAFDIGPDGWLYAPRADRSDPASGGRLASDVIKVDVTAADPASTLEVVATGFEDLTVAKFGPDHKLYVSDIATGKIWRVDVTAPGGAPELAGQTSPGIDNLAFGPDGKAIVTKLVEDELLVFDPKLPADESIQSRLKLANLTGPGGLALSPDEATLYVADVFSIRSIDARSGETIGTFRVFGTPLVHPFGISVDGDELISTSFFGSTIQVLDRATGAVKQFIYGPLNNIIAPHRAMRLPDGRLVVTDPGTGALLLGRGGAFERVASELALPTGLALSPDSSRAWVAQSGAGNIVEIELSTGAMRIVYDGLVEPGGITVDEAGERLYCVEVGKKRVVEIGVTTGQLQVVYGPLPLGSVGPRSSRLTDAWLFNGIARASDGTLFVTTDLNNGLVALVPSGSERG